VEQEATGGANVALVELDIDGEPELAMSAGVTSTPEVHYYLGGKWVNSLTGVRNKREYRNAIQGLSRLPES
jgi:thioredoxin reductase (NADPH)